MSLGSIFLDPNVVYVLLVAALWAVVTAVLLPGTGLIEVIALGGIGASILLLAQLPTNWLPVILIVLGVMMFLVLPLADYRFLGIGLLGLTLQAIGGWTLFFGSTLVSPVIIGVSVIVSLVYYRFALVPALQTQRGKPQMLEDQSLIGLRGRVQAMIDPVGTVYVSGESWTARRGDDLKDAIGIGAEVIVREREGLTLYVEPIKEKRDPQNDE